MAVVCTCKQCGKVFKAYPSEVSRGGGVYCSRQCANVVVGERLRAANILRQNKIERKCEQCGTVFMASPAVIKNGGGRFCSNHCARTKPKNHYVCGTCGRDMYTAFSHVKQGRGKYCSSVCYHTARKDGRLRGENSPLWKGGSNYDRGKNWDNQRKLAFERDKGVCQYCGKTPQKHQRKNSVHHIRPYRDFNGDYIAANQLTNLITLCNHCHPKAEYGKIILQPYLL